MGEMNYDKKGRFQWEKATALLPIVYSKIWQNQPNKKVLSTIINAQTENIKHLLNCKSLNDVEYLEAFDLCLKYENLLILLENMD